MCFSSCLMQTTLTGSPTTTMSPMDSCRSLAAMIIMAGLIASADDQVKVMQPPWLAAQFTEGYIEHSPALFGVPPAGRSMVGQVLYAPPNDDDACKPFNSSMLRGYDNTIFLMVDRGSCTFVEKVRHVQQVGGHAAIIVDNVDEPFLPFMADDGTGKDINIPSVLISDEDGKLLKNALLKTPPEKVILKMTWLMPNPDGRVEWAMWTTPVDDVAIDFKDTFGAVVKSLGPAAQFTPHYIILDGDTFGCLDGGCGNKCTNGGRYCNYDPDENPDAGLSGADVVQESLRQLCFFQVVNDTNKPELWWDYVSLFQKNCDSNVARFNKACSYNVMTTLGVATPAIDKCIADSGGSGDKDGINSKLEAEMAAERLYECLFIYLFNSKLEAEMAAEREYGVRWWPIILINGHPYYEALTCPVPVDLASCGPLNMICGGYAPETAPCTCTPTQGCDLCSLPDACGTCMKPDSKDFKKNKDDCVKPPPPTAAPNNNGQATFVGDAGPRGVSAGGVIGIVLVCCGLVAGGLFLFFNRRQQKMREDIDQLLAQYQPMDGNRGQTARQMGTPLMAGNSNSDVEGGLTAPGVSSATVHAAPARPPAPTKNSGTLTGPATVVANSKTGLPSGELFSQISLVKFFLVTRSTELLHLQEWNTGIPFGDCESQRILNTCFGKLVKCASLMHCATLILSPVHVVGSQERQTPISLLVATIE
eukprot:g77477.t1